MKGLLIKDWRIIAAQKRYMLMVGAIGVFMALTQENLSFCIMYMTMVASIMAISTLNYDSYEENGMAYLMTLPVKRSAYVLEKYLFVFVLVSSVSTLFSLLGMAYEWIVNGSIPWMDQLIYWIVAIVMGIVVMALMIPANLKFGAEKSRVVMLIFGGSILVIFYSLKSAMEKRPEILHAMEKLEELPGWQWGIILAVGVVLILSVSMLIAVHVIEKKEY